MDRHDQQAKGSLVIPRSDGSTAFIDYTDNAAAGRHSGLEWEMRWQPTDRFGAEITLGLLDAHFDDYVTATGTDLSGRDQPQAPNWQYSVGATWQPFALASLHVEVTGSDAYFFSDRHEVRAPETHQLNASLSGAGDNGAGTFGAGTSPMKIRSCEGSAPLVTTHERSMRLNPTASMENPVW